MIKDSDIIISVYEDRKTNPYHPDMVVEATLDLHEVVTINHRYGNDPRAIDRAKEMVKHVLYQRMYGELRDSIEEMYAIAMVKMPYGQELDEVRKLKGQIDRIMRGET